MLRLHVMRNALLPIVTILGMDVGLALGGAFFTETVYGLPGLGKLAVGSIDNVDLATTQGVSSSRPSASSSSTSSSTPCTPGVDPRIRLS